MSHWPVLPVLLPLLCASVLLLLPRLDLRLQAGIGIASILGQLLAAWVLVERTAGGEVLVYLLGNWPAPFGITLVADRLAALLVGLTGLVALGSLAACGDGAARSGPRFHGLFQLQLMGVNGAFLTGDLFNLFVFFEVLLIASYALLLQAANAERLRAGLHYVVVNLGGSVLFLVGVGLLYGVTGTLNMADLADRIAVLPARDTSLVQAAGLILLVVFSIKSAALPLNFWLPRTYAAAALPIAALFAILTKVGIYSIARVYSLLFPADAGPVGAMLGVPLLAVGLLTVSLAALGTLGSRDLRRAASYLVMGSAGTLLTALALGTPAALGAALFYLLQSTLATSALFLVAELIGRQRGELFDRLEAGPPLALFTRTGLLFLAAAIAAIGLPPLAGFMAKALLLQAAATTPAMLPFALVLLGASLVNTLALARAGSRVFWKPAHPDHAPPPVTGPVGGLLAGAAGLLAAVLLVAAAAGPVHRFSVAAAADLFQPATYRQAVLSARPVPRPGTGSGETP